MSKRSDKIRVAVLYGGRSSEHEVSLRSAANVIEQLDRSQFDVVPIGIDKQGTWFLGEDPARLGQSALTLSNDDNRQLFTPDWIGKSIVSQKSSELIARSSKDNRLFDVIFPAMHGVFCEDGSIQGLFELADVPYVGCGVLSSAVGMDKDIAKRLAIQAGIDVHPYLVLVQGTWQRSADALCAAIERELAFPVFVKPANTGSSVGVQKVKSRAELPQAINEAFRFDTKILVEKAIDAIELELAVLESAEVDADPIVSVVGEIRPTHEFYSYAAKYIDADGAHLLIPAEVSEEIQKAAQTIAKKLFMTLGCEGMARIDLFLEKSTNRIYFNELNTLPGFTQISMYPKLIAASGISYSELLTRLIHLAIQRHKRKSQLERNYTG